MSQVIELFTDREIKLCREMVNAGKKAVDIREQIIDHIMDRIKRDIGQENDAMYMAYRLIYESTLQPYPRGYE